MGVTPDRFPGAREEDEIQLQEDTVAPAVSGGMKFVSGAFQFLDDTGVFDPSKTRAHASTHDQGGVDEISVQNLGSGATTVGKKLQADGSGGLEFVDVNEMPAATDEGQVLYSLDGLTFTAQQPLVSSDGWLTNDDGILLVVG